MKMGFLSNGVFWGAALVIFGISMLLKAVFHIDIPVFRILFGFIIIYFGIRIMTGWHGCTSANSVVFAECEMSSKDIKGDYNVFFGKSTVDLSAADIKEKTVFVKTETVFGETILVVDRNMPLKVQADAAFSGVSMPDGNTVSFGSLSYVSPTYKEGANCLKIRADVVFGSLKIVYK